MSKSVLATVVVLVILLAGGYFAYTKYSNKGDMTQTPSYDTTSSTPTPSTTTEGSASGQTADMLTVKITDTGFDPQSITIKAGQTVTWTNSGTKTSNVSSDPHPTHTNYPPLNLGTIAVGASKSLMFDKPGTYTYHNHLNPSQKGTVIVQ